MTQETPELQRPIEGINIATKLLAKAKHRKKATSEDAESEKFNTFTMEAVYDGSDTMHKNVSNDTMGENERNRDPKHVNDSPAQHKFDDEFATDANDTMKD